MSIPKINVAEALRHMLGEGVLCGSTHLNTKEQYDKLKWADARPKPSWQELTAWWNANILEVEQAKVYEAKITARMDKNARDLAVEQLKTEEEIPDDYEPATITSIA